MPFARITYNSKDWKHPSGPFGKCPKLWETEKGFGFEEWYRNESFQKEEHGEIWQYGYLQCFKSAKNHKGITYRNVDLFTRQCHCGANNILNRFIAVAHYNSIYVLTDKERFIAEEEFGNELQDVRNELIGLGVDVVNNFDNHPDGLPKINFKYKVKDEKYLYDSLSPIFFNPQNRMWRYRNFYDGRIEKCLKF